MGGNFSFKVRSCASGILEPGIFFLRLAVSSRVVEVLDFSFSTLFSFVFYGVIWVCHLISGGSF